MRKTFMSVRLVLATLVGLFAIPALLMAPASASNGANSNLNHPDYYEGLGYGSCSKTDSPGDPYNLGSPPAGTSWTLLVLKAGSASSNDDWNTLVPNPAPGPYLHPSGKNLSHVITCHNGSGNGGNNGQDNDDDGNGNNDDGNGGNQDNDDDGNGNNDDGNGNNNGDDDDGNGNNGGGDQDDDGNGNNDDGNGGNQDNDDDGNGNNDDGNGNNNGDDDDGNGNNDDDDGGGTTTTTTTTTTTPGGPCDDYTPTQVSLNPPSAAPGDVIVVTGVAVPGDTVTVEFEISPGNLVTLGSVVAGPTGQFTLPVTVPTVSDGNYDVIVSSTDCPVSVSVTLEVKGLVFSGCGTNNAARTLEQGQTFIWQLHVPSFDTSQPVSMTMEKGGTTYSLYSGAWPASDELTLTIPAAAPTGKYDMIQTGTKPNGKTGTKKCPIWVELEYQGAGARTPLSSGDGESLPLTVLPIFAVLTLGTFTLFRLRSTRP